MTPRYWLRTARTAALVGLLSSGASAQTLLLHLSFDGTLRYSGIVGEPRFVVADGATQPVFVPGRFGQALLFDGPVTVAAPFSLDHAEYPRVTVTAWVRHEADASGVREVFSSGSTAGVRMAVGARSLTTRVGGYGVSHGTAGVPTGEWVFIAVVVDTAAGSARMFVNEEVFQRDGIDTSTKPPNDYRDPGDPTIDAQPWVFAGANSLRNFGSSSRVLVIDELRVYAGALSDEQIGELREPSAQPHAGQPVQTGLQPSPAGTTNVPGPNAPAGATPGGSVAASELLPASCASNDDCAEGTYCAIERLCHPVRHLPLSSLTIDRLEQPLYTLTPETGAGGGSGSGSESDDPVIHASDRPVGAPMVERVSGEEYKTTVTVDLVDRFITEIAWNEVGDRPCKLAIAGMDGTGSGESVTLGGCGTDANPFNNTQGARRVALTEPADAPNNVVGMGVRRLAVCDNDRNNHRIKGIEIGGNLIQEHGSTQIPTPRSREELNNCREWRYPGACDETRLATGLVLHYTRASGYNEQIVGIQLICRRFEYTVE